MASFQMRQRDPLLDQNTQAMLERRGRELIGVALLGLALVLSAMLWSYSPNDPGWMVSTQEPAQNLFGRVGAGIASMLMVLIGKGAWAIPASLSAWGLRYVLHRGAERVLSRLFFALVGVALASAYASTLETSAAWGHGFGLGGMFGDTIVAALLGVLPLSASFGLKLLSFVSFFALLAMMLYVMAFNRTEIHNLTQFCLRGTILSYSRLLSLLGKGAAGVMTQGRDLNQRRRLAQNELRSQKRTAPRQEAFMAEPMLASAPVAAPVSAPVAPVAVGSDLVQRRPPALQVNAPQPTAPQMPPPSAMPVSTARVGHGADDVSGAFAPHSTGAGQFKPEPLVAQNNWQAPQNLNSGPRPMTASDTQNTAPSKKGGSEARRQPPRELPREKVGFLARMRNVVRPEAELVEPELPKEAFQTNQPTEERIKARISDVIRSRASHVSTGQGGTPTTAPARRAEPPVLRVKGPQPLIADTRSDSVPFDRMAAYTPKIAPLDEQYFAPEPQYDPQSDNYPTQLGAYGYDMPAFETRPQEELGYIETSVHEAYQPYEATPEIGYQEPTYDAQAYDEPAYDMSQSHLVPEPEFEPEPEPSFVAAPPAPPVPEPVQYRRVEQDPSRQPAASRRIENIFADIEDDLDDDDTWADDLAMEALPSYSAMPPPVVRAQPISAPPRAVEPVPVRRPETAAQQPEKREQIVAPVHSSSYELPPLSLLASADTVLRNELSDEVLEENARMLESVLDDYGVKGEIVSVRPGPVVTMYELEPAPGLKASRVIGLADDIARSMSALSARVSTVPGRTVIGIELPNVTREKVVLREIITARDFGDNNLRLPLALGKDIAGDAVVANLAKMPHLLIAGTTGSGKSVAINTMILSLLYKLTPEECRLIMIDPKMLELSVYDGIPHLLSPVVTDPKKAVVALKWVVGEMEERYRKMSKMGVRNIEGYNARVREALSKGEMFKRTIQTGFDDETGDPVFETDEFAPQAFPYIVVIVDEMADLMMVAGKEIEACIQRLAQMARASGIHLIMATQRPSVDVITGTIKANFPTRISFQVTSKIDSRTILGEQGAEQLLGQGDMLYMGNGQRVTRIHGPFVSDEEVEEIVNHLKSFGPPTYMSGVVDGPDDDRADDIDQVLGLAGNGDSEDALYDQAVAIVARDRKCSTSYIQRKLGIGYNKAARLVEQMESEGVVSAANHVGKREILLPEN